MPTHVVDQRRDWLRLLGGLLFSAGAIALLLRKASQWGAGAEFVTLLVPCALCLGLGVAGRHAPGPADRIEPFRSTLLLIGIVLLPVTLSRLVAWIGGTPGDSLNVFWIFGLTAAVAAFASLRLGAVYQLLVAGIAGIVAWISLWDKILDHPKADTVRWLLLILAAIYIALAFVLHRRGLGEGRAVAGDHDELSRDEARRHGDLITVAGIAAITAGLITLGLLLRALPVLAERVSVGQSATPSEFWNILLLVESLALIGYAAWAGLRGPGYVGSFGLIAFVVIVGLDISARVHDHAANRVLWWPLILLVLGAASLALGYVLRPGRPTATGGPAAAGAPPPEATPPPAPGPGPQPPAA
jgi:hypothetical protein